jgi:hypothetical protein
MARRTWTLLASLCLLGVACTTTDETVGTDDGETTDTVGAETTEIVTETTVEIVPDGTTQDVSEDVADNLTAGDEVDCSLEALQGGDEEFGFTSAYRVVDGVLGELCFGVDDDTVLDAWDSLATITPDGQLGDLVLFGGFEPDGEIAEETLAFVNVVDSDASGFQMSINTVESEADPDELLLTLAHEFTHVFTATPAQLDRTDEAIDGCTTFFNGEGCYLDESLLYAWILEFWNPEVLATVNVFEESVDDADARCADDDGFFGPYAASNPEEDFAEAFSAFVFDVAPETDGQAARLDWIAAQPGLAEFRDRAEAAGWTPLANNFDVCGI